MTQKPAKKKQLIIYGNGHMAKMVYQFVKHDFEVLAFTVDESCMEATELCGLPIIPFDGVEKHFSPELCYMLIAVGFVEMNGVRERKHLEAKSKGFNFVNYVHSSVVWHDSLTIGENNVILDHASIHPYTSIGNGNFISSNSNIGHGCFIGDNNWINAGVSVAGETSIENNVFLGVNSAVGHGLAVKDKTFVGACTQINRDTELGSVYLSESGEKHRLGSEAFLRFSAGMQSQPSNRDDS